MDKKVLFIQWLKDSGLSNQTIKDYSWVAKRFPEDLQQIDVDMFCNKYRRTIDRATIKNYIEFIMLRFPDSKHHYINLRIPKIKGRTNRKLPDYPTEEEMLRIKDVFTGDREKLMVLLSFYCALRPQSIIALRKKDFMLNEWKEDETRPCKIKLYDGEQIVFVKPHIIGALLKKEKFINAKEDTKLFNIGYNRWYKLLTEASRKALGRTISPHKLRHGGATWLLTKKEFTLQEVSDFLGHKSIATTQIYAHLDKDKMMDKYNS